MVVFAFCRGALAKDIENKIMRRFGLTAGASWAVHDESRKDFVISNDMPSGKYSILMIPPIEALQVPRAPPTLPTHSLVEIAMGHRKEGFTFYPGMPEIARRFELSPGAQWVLRSDCGEDVPLVYILKFAKYSLILREEPPRRVGTPGFSSRLPGRRSRRPSSR